MQFLAFSELLNLSYPGSDKDLAAARIREKPIEDSHRVSPQSSLSDMEGELCLEETR